LAISEAVEKCSRAFFLFSELALNRKLDEQSL